MIQLQLIQPGVPEQRVQVEGDVVTLGRSPDCDVVVNQPYVSKRHLRILAGVVVVDLGSSNGTFIDGEKISGPVVLGSRTLSLGNRDLIVRVQADGAPAGGGGAPAGGSEVVVELEQFRSQNTVLSLENQRLRRELAEAQDTSAADERLARVTAENQGLVQRIESLKETLEQSAESDADSVQARLATDRLLEVQARCEALEKELAAARAQPAPEAPSAAEPAGPVEAAPAAPASDLFFRLQRENAELRARVSELETSAGSPGSAAAVAGAGTPSEMFFKLQSEISELKRKLAEAQGGAAGAAAAPAQPSGGGDAEAMARLLAENTQLRGRLAVVTTELEQARTAPRPATVPPGSTAGPATSVGASDPGVTALLVRLVDQDIGSQVLDAGSPVNQFLVGEQFRFLRQVEKVVTRLAGDFIQLYQLNTMLPDMEGNYRALAADVIAHPSAPEPRSELTRYLDELGRWLVVSLGAHRQAAARFAAELKNDLTERSLLGDTPIPGLKKMTGQAGSELWRRVCDYVKQLSPDIVDDRLEKLAREAAQELMQKES